MSKVTYDINKDYLIDLKQDELLEKDGKQFVYLRGLERLARLRGITRQWSRVESSPSSDNLFAIVSSGYEFEDGASYEDCADATEENCEGAFKKYLTAMASARSKARALRNAFGISACSVEEIGPEKSPPCTDAQQSLVKHLMREKKIDLAGALKLIKVTDVEALDQLTKDEASKLINKLQKV